MKALRTRLMMETSMSLRMMVTVALVLGACTSTGTVAPTTTTTDGADATPVATDTTALTASALPSPIGTIAVTPSSCALDVPTKLTAGPVAIAASNESDGIAGWDMWRIADGHTYEELAAHIDGERRLAESGQPGLGHPGFVGDLIRSGLLDPGASNTVVGTLRQGTYGVVCVRSFPEVGEPRPFAVAGPIVVD